MEDNRGPLFENLRKLINVIDELRDVGLQQYINLPRIAVLGTQSGGKSSLLEAIMGIDCLPRGEGVCTRRPLELRLVHTPHAVRPWAVFEEFKGQKIEDFTQVTKKIVELTDALTKGTRNIIDKPIVLTVYSSTCPDLTLIDLPGITRIPLPDQDKNIYEVTINMAKRYCTDSRTVILCVVPANQDLTTSDGLHLAQQWDPKGERTIGVVTKIDLMDRGTNAKKILLNQEIPLKLGFVGVKGRSQQDIHDKLPVVKAVAMEKEFFAQHPVYSTLPAGHTGTEALSNKLTKILFHHIRLCLPDILKEIVIKSKEFEERLRDLGTPLPSTPKEKSQLLWNMIMDFTENFKNVLKGKFDGRRVAKLTDELSGGAKIKKMFHDLYSDFYKSKPSEIYSDKDIELAIKYHQGDSIPGFPSMDAFLYLTGPILEKLKEPAANLISDVHGYLENLAFTLIDKIFMRFPGIVDDITEITTTLLREEKDKTKQLVDEIIESEQNYIYTNDLGYLVQNSNFIPVIEQQAGQPPKQIDPNKVFIGELRNRIDAYINIVLRNIRDLIPKLVGNFLVSSVQSRLQYTIHNEINRKEELLNALGEPPHITAERETLTKVLNILNKAKKVLQKDPDLAVPLKQEESALEEPPAQKQEPKTTSSMFGTKTESKPVETKPVETKQAEAKPVNQSAPTNSFSTPKVVREEASPDNKSNGAPLGSGGFNPLAGAGKPETPLVSGGTQSQGPLGAKPTGNANPLAASAQQKPATGGLFGNAGLFGGANTKK